MYVVGIDLTIANQRRIQTFPNVRSYVRVQLRDACSLLWSTTPNDVDSSSLQ